MASLKPYEVEIDHPSAPRTLVVHRNAWENGTYPGWSLVGEEAPSELSESDPDEDLDLDDLGDAELDPDDDADTTATEE